ncbi:MAG: hypothetical protein U1A24_06045 [Cypionkella sp.]|uniref:hypothetical protein n=1 Tax=Cypionkella sp. TaxID=2811411 RepID=UPI002AB9A6F3|nr:hypothetical protein [Cypionkella sp.]MDZ4310101.1 hypothetical protein [Cypionkella sp.]
MYQAQADHPAPQTPSCSSIPGAVILLALVVRGFAIVLFYRRSNQEMAAGELSADGLKFVMGRRISLPPGLPDLRTNWREISQLSKHLAAERIAEQKSLHRMVAKPPSLPPVVNKSTETVPP